MTLKVTQGHRKWHDFSLYVTSCQWSQHLSCSVSETLLLLQCTWTWRPATLRCWFDVTVEITGTYAVQFAWNRVTAKHVLQGLDRFQTAEMTSRDTQCHWWWSVFQCNMSVPCTVSEIVTYLPKFKRSRDPKYTLFDVTYHACASTHQNQAEYNLKCLSSRVSDKWQQPP